MCLTLSWPAGCVVAEERMLAKLLYPGQPPPHLLFSARWQKASSLPRSPPKLDALCFVWRLLFPSFLSRAAVTRKTIHKIKTWAVLSWNVTMPTISVWKLCCLWSKFHIFDHFIRIFHQKNSFSVISLHPDILQIPTTILSSSAVCPSNLVFGYCLKILVFLSASLKIEENWFVCVCERLIGWCWRMIDTSLVQQCQKRAKGKIIGLQKK